MTILFRAAALAAFSLGIVGLAAVSVPGSAAERASDAIVAQAALPQLFDLTATRAAAEAPAIDAVVTTVDRDQRDQDQTAVDAADPAKAEFQSLAAAVAGQPTPSDLSTELRCLAGAIYYEAKGEPLAGQLAVAEVIINRAHSGRFPTTLCGVVIQPGQFSFIHGGAMPAINPALPAYRTALAVAQVALRDAWDSPAPAAMFFHARYVAPSWSKARVASIGNHIFYR